jgi:beta-glucosidase-like glycosyl hydrolase/CubicO group peptidase (beta-lactamase class C family)
MKTFFQRKHSKIIACFIILAIGLVSAQRKTQEVINISHKQAIPNMLPKHLDPAFLHSGEDWADSVLATLTLEQKIAQFFMVAVLSSDIEKSVQDVDGWIKEYGIGGLIFFKGTKARQAQLSTHFQEIAKVPLLIGIDGEWGPAMRLTDCERYPFQLTMGATQNPKLIEKAGYWIGKECQALAIHIDFAPDVDVNSNPKNPVINYRSFGENPQQVALLSGAFVKGMESSGILSCAKHFPGHGDTDKDSHKELPTVNHSLTTLQTVDFLPFKNAIQQGVSSVMVAHLNVPSLDSSGTPTSLSPKVIQTQLKDSLQFKGLVISDALNMQGVSGKYGATDVVVKAFLAGNDILLFPESVDEAIQVLASKVKYGEISETEINRRCKKVLQAKNWAFTQNKAAKPLNEADSIQIQLCKQQIAEQAITILENKNNTLPLKDMTPKTAIISIGKDDNVLKNRINDYMDADWYNVSNGTEAIALQTNLSNYQRIISVLLSKSVLPSANYGFPAQWSSYLSALNEKQENIVLMMGNPYVLTNAPTFPTVDALVMGYENSKYTQDAAIQVIVGALPSVGKLPVNVNDHYTLGMGVQTEGGLRLRYTQPEELGINHHDFDAIDSIAMGGIENGAYPGCQVIFAYKGNVIFRKNYGHLSYGKKIKVNNASVYDIASITKIAASVLSLMYLDGQNKFNLDSTIGHYLPALTKGTAYHNLVMRDILTHQARLTPWIPFYLHTLQNGVWKPNLFSTQKKVGFTTQVSENLFIKDTYEDSIYKEILATPLRPQKEYKYSDLGYYFVRLMIKNLTHEAENDFVLSHFYAPMGLHTMRYLPLNYMPKETIAPTEKDNVFRKEWIHGYVHDQGAALLGGVGGHAGLFSNATDLCALMQMYLNGGKYGGRKYIEKSVLDEYTRCQFCPSNRRGAGFDKPVRSLDGGPTCNLVSLESFGHSGFTGTLAWADPKYNISYVFLSNSINPSAENKKLLHMGQRTKIQAVFYKAILNAQK